MLYTLLVAGLIVVLLVFLLSDPKRKKVTYANIGNPVESVEEAQDIIGKVAGNKQKWADTTPKERLEYLLKMKDYLIDLTDEWGQLSTAVRKYPKEQKGLRSSGGFYGAGITGLYLNTLIYSYQILAQTGDWPKVNIREFNGQQIARVFPLTTLHKASQVGVVGEIWIEKGKKATQGQSAKSTPKLATILGAGNFEAPTDILTKLFIENQVVIYKSHPMNKSAVDPILPRLLQDLIADGFVGLTTGGADIGSAIIQDDKVDEVMMTGGCATYDRIVWGAPSEQATRKSNDDPVLKKPFKAELGAVSPWIVIPGKWSDKELKHQAEFLVSCKLANGSAVCASPQVVVLDSEWEQKEEFIKLVRKTFEEFPDFATYYSGASDRAKRLCDAHGGDMIKKNLRGDFVKPVIIEREEDDEKDDVLRNEAFAPVIAFQTLNSGGEVGAFMKKATSFANDVLFGSLSCSVMIDPRTEKAHKDDLERMIQDLKWGSIAINEWGGSCTFFGQLVWGAYPGRHEPKDIQSGMGKMLNSNCLDHPEKSVLRSTFVTPLHLEPPKDKVAKIFARMIQFSVDPRWGSFLKLASAAVLGL